LVADLVQPPRRLLFLIQGVIAGLAVGLAVGLAREWFERRWCHPDTFENHSGIPVLAVVPHLPAWGPHAQGQVPTIGWSGR
jgi:capsular polysaccharide biosynthesis protein